MRCFFVKRRLSPHLDGELRPRTAAKVAAHLAACPPCAAEYERLSEVGRRFAGAPRFSAPAGFTAAVMAKAQPGQMEVFLPARLLVRLAAAAAVVLAICAGAVSGDILTGSLARHRESPGAAVVASLSLDAFEANPPGSLGNGYLAVSGDRR
jgi:anti-sigma factor RsiW